MLASFILDVFAILAGAFAMLWLLVARFGHWTGSAIVPFEDIQVSDEPVLYPLIEDDDLILMPDHLRTHSEMVAWMTQELPKITGRAGSKREAR